MPVVAGGCPGDGSYSWNRTNLVSISHGVIVPMPGVTPVRRYWSASGYVPGALSPGVVVAVRSVRRHSPWRQELAGRAAGQGSGAGLRAQVSGTKGTGGISSSGVSFGKAGIGRLAYQVSAL